MKAFEARSDADLINDCMWLLQKFLGKTLPRPTNMKRTRWISNRNFLAAYSYVSVEQERSKTSPKDLAMTLNTSSGKPSVLFAREATDVKFNSYTHGAIASGYRAATELITFLKT
jgi:monoamine oxidase